MITERVWTLVSRKLSGEATISEITELHEFIQTQANADLYLQAIEEYWKIPPEHDIEFLEATYHLHINRLKEKGLDLETDKENDETASLYIDCKNGSPKPAKRKRLYITAAIFSIITLLFFALYNPGKSPALIAGERITQSEVATKMGTRTKIQLPDGSSVWLNANSKLVYDNLHFGKKQREVTLTGEAYFDVVKITGKPFVIHTSRINIKVTGTAFNVKAYPGETNTETSLIRGSIEVTMNGRKEKIMMKPNDKLVIRNEVLPADKANTPTARKSLMEADSTFILMGHITLSDDENTVVETAWVHNKLLFDKETFEAVALKMERWYGVSIQFEDDKLKSQTLTGTFESETITEALKALQISTPFFRYKINNQHISIFKYLPPISAQTKHDST